jgi:glyoxylase-like metal-dependent hydrolase (beta-lactamase superfamily II)/8-oxo-dGTP pyrophosphatase MutT (NUDIX family)
MTGGHVLPPDARAAASLLLLRDGARGLEVLMLRRAERDGDDPRSGAAVFPGGVLDARDREAHAWVVGADDASTSARLGLASGGLDYVVAALRETFEEAGLLLVDRPVDAEHATRLEPLRERLQRGEIGIAEVLREQGLRLDARGLAYFSHWLTPPGTAKRFDTRFFAAPAPVGQLARADMGEAVEMMWLTPAEALDAARALKLLPVTRRTLMELATHADTATAMAAIRAKRAVPLIMPRRCVDRRGPRVVLPHEPGYAEIGRLDPAGRGDAWIELVPGRVVVLSSRVLRITAPNPGVMTGPGTNTYLVAEPPAGDDGDRTTGHGGAGEGTAATGRAWTVIDPGPAIDEHVQAILAAAQVDGGRIERILVTHTHRDHSPAAALLTSATGAPVWGRLPAHPAGQDAGFTPQHQPLHGERLVLGPTTVLRLLHTPGHASNHVCALLEAEKLLFTGDHVMQGSTVVINPPDGDMAAYLRSLEALLDEDLAWLAPGHGFLVAEPHAVLRALIAHRLAREAKVLAAVKAADAPAAASDLVARVYDDVPAALHGVAQRSLLAHLLKLAQDGRAVAEGDADPALARWRSAPDGAGRAA